MRIGILGSGVVGQALARGLTRHGHEVQIGTRKTMVDDFAVGDLGDVVDAADLVFLSVLGAAAVDVAAGVRRQLRG